MLPPMMSAERVAGGKFAQKAPAVISDLERRGLLKASLETRLFCMWARPLGWGHQQVRNPTPTSFKAAGSNQMKATIDMDKHWYVMRSQCRKGPRGVHASGAPYSSKR